MAEPIRFYGRTNPKYFPFSNFYYAKMVDNDGITWLTNEHYFQAMKFTSEAMYDKNLTIRQYINMFDTPAKAVHQGRRLSPMREDWNDEVPMLDGFNILVKDTVMYRGLLLKFTQHEDLKQLLLGTGNTEIIEDSPIDFYWGCGSDNSGKNMLGKLLMHLRTELRK